MNGIWRTRIFAVCFTTLLSVAFLPGKVMSQTREVRVGVYQNEPKIFINEAGEASGFFIELLNEIAEQEGWKITYVQCEWADCLAMLENGQIDLMPDVAYSEARDAIYDFHKIPVIESWSRVYTSPQAQINELPDLNGKRVAVLQGSIQQVVFEELMNGFGYTVILVPANSLMEAFTLAQNGNADAAIANHLFGDYFQQEYGLEQTTIDFNPSKLYYATAQRHNSDLLEAIDRNLKAWVSEPGSPYYTTYGHWEGKPAYRIPQSVYWGVGIAGGLLVIALGMIALLRNQVQARTRHLEQANQALRHSEEQFRLIMENLADLVAVVDLDGYRIYNSPSYNRILGSPDMLVGTSSFDDIHPEDQERVRKSFVDTVRTGKGQRLEYRLIDKNGQPHYIESQGSVIHDAQDQVSQVIVVSRDVTEHRQNERKFRAIFEQAPLGIAIIDSSTGQFLVINPRYCEIVGYSESEMLTRTFQEITHPEDLQADLEGLQQMREGQQRVFQMDKRYLRKDGIVVWVTLTSVSLWETPGANRQHLAMVEDITERKQVEERLEASKKRLSLIFDTVNDVIFLLSVEPDDCFRFESVNPAFLTVTGMNYENVIGKRIEDVLPEATHTIVKNNYKQAISENKTVKWEEVSVYPTGTLYGVVSVTPAYNSAGVCTHLIGSVHDVTEIRRVQEEISKLNQELEHRVAERTRELEVAKQRAESADHLKSAFLATMSHELRTPLNSIIGFTGVLLQGLAGPLNAEQAKQMGMARGSAHHLLALINDVLDISKIEAGQLEIKSTPFEMRSVIEEAMKLVAPQVEKKGLSLIAALGSNVGQVVSDQRRVEQILINLLNNAIKFTEHGEIRIECRVHDGFIETSVHDSGIGIRSEDMPKLFAPFRQIETGLNRRHEGTGLGLSICKNLVELLGGQICVESEWGKGSVFTFTLPLDAK